MLRARLVVAQGATEHSRGSLSRLGFRPSPPTARHRRGVHPKQIGEPTHRTGDRAGRGPRVHVVRQTSLPVAGHVPVIRYRVSPRPRLLVRTCTRARSSGCRAALKRAAGARNPGCVAPSRAGGGGARPSFDIDVASFRDLVVELARCEDALRVPRSARPSHDEAPRELTRLTSRQRLVSGSGCCGRRRASRPRGSVESPFTRNDPRPAPQSGLRSAPAWPFRPPTPTARAVLGAGPCTGVSEPISCADVLVSQSSEGGSPSAAEEARPATPAADEARPGDQAPGHGHQRRPGFWEDRARQSWSTQPHRVVWVSLDPGDDREADFGRSCTTPSSITVSWRTPRLPTPVCRWRSRHR